MFEDMDLRIADATEYGRLPIKGTLNCHSQHCTHNCHKTDNCTVIACYRDSQEVAPS